MAKVAPPGMPASTAAVNKLRKSFLLLDLNVVEAKLVHNILHYGKKLRWELYIGRNYADETALLLGVHPSSLKNAMAKLIKRGWMRRGTNDVGQAYVQLTIKFVEACQRVEQRREVKFRIGAVTWRKYNGDDELADLLIEMEPAMPEKEFKDRVKAALHEVAESDLRTRARGRRNGPGRSPKLTSQVAKADLILIDGERKYGP